MPATATINTDGSSTQGSRILDVVRQFQELDENWADDCRIVSEYYSGQVAESPQDQDTLGLTDHANFAVGKAGMVRAKEETLAAFVKPHRLLHATFRDHPGTAIEKKSAEGKMNKAIDRMLREWDLILIDEFTQMVDRHVMHGDAVMMFPPEDEGWRPFNAKILTDADAPQNAHDDNFMRWAVYTDLQIGDALTAIATGQEGWTSQAEKFIRSLWKRRYDSVDSKTGQKASFVSTFDDMFSMVEHISPEEWATQGRVGANLCEFFNSRFRCFFYYQKDFTNPEEDGIPVDLYIVARVQPKLREEDDWYDGDPLLYARKGAYSDVKHAIVDFVLDTKLGVTDPSWSTISGLAHTQYNADRFTNLLLSSQVNNSIWRNMNLFQVEDHTDVKMIQKFLKKGLKDGSVIPAGASYVDKSKTGGNPAEMLEMIRFLQLQANAQAVNLTGQSAAPEGELRVQAAHRQQFESRTVSNRGALFAGKMRVLVQEIGRRIARELQFGEFFGRQEQQIDRLRKELKRLKVDISLITEENLVITYSKLTGDGDPIARRERINEMIARIGLVPATARNGVLRTWFAEVMDDWELADEVYEEAEEREPEQLERALKKAADMMDLGVPHQVTQEDVPEPQLQVLVPLMDQMAQRATQDGMFRDQRDLNGFIAIGQYAANLALVLDQRGQKDLANQFMAEIQRISTMANGPANNLQAHREAQQDPRAQIEQGKLQLAAAREQREERTFQHKQAKDGAQHFAKSQQQEFNQMAQTRRIITEEERLRLEQQRAQQDAINVQMKRLDDRERNQS